ncbi:MAG: glycosyltransferase, partial [Fimbriimonadaceae bacterium]|nr:glycosyltransferase [Fimbriimonadaceae bacterium]
MAEISMIIASYCRTKELLSTIHSFLAQSFQDFELVIVNDGPPSPEI